ncbi:plasmid recombination protein (plasmid) [Klebsiella quasipneumoniae]|uniref:plasmid recombination protein n=1 Tax=Klebsiella quasipneumoniae TaxID=1463165 RepID=UPI0019168D9B|nr:plasmid recombination protein [Klebsiella quasipneumoniae]
MSPHPLGWGQCFHLQSPPYGLRYSPHAKAQSRCRCAPLLKHAFRAQNTPNADPARLKENSHLGANSVEEAMKAFQNRLPEKIRKNGVLAIEYLITGSPDGMNSKSRRDQDAYFTDALAWLKGATRGREPDLCRHPPG